MENIGKHFQVARSQREVEHVRWNSIKCSSFLFVIFHLILRIYATVFIYICIYIIIIIIQVLLCYLSWRFLWDGISQFTLSGIFITSYVKIRRIGSADSLNLYLHTYFIWKWHQNSDQIQESKLSELFLSTEWLALNTISSVSHNC